VKNQVKVSDLKSALSSLAASRPPPIQNSNNILVKLLRDSFQLGCSAILLANISPVDRDYQDTVASLDFMKILRAYSRRSRKLVEKQEQLCEQCVKLELKHQQDMATLQGEHELATQMIKEQEARKISEYEAEAEQRLHSQLDLVLAENMELAELFSLTKQNIEELEAECSRLRNKLELERRSRRADKGSSAGNDERENVQESNKNNDDDNDDNDEEEKEEDQEENSRDENLNHVDNNKKDDEFLNEDVKAEEGEEGEEVEGGDIDDFLKKMDSLVENMEDSFNDFVHFKEDPVIQQRDTEIAKLREQIKMLMCHDTRCENT
jgi:hypothetical protein